MILIIEDDRFVAQRVGQILSEAGYVCVDAIEADAGFEAFRSTAVLDLVVLELADSDSADADIALCRWIKEVSDVPVVMLTANDSARARVERLNAGADDCLARPFHPSELLARVRAQLRRSAHDSAPLAATMDAWRT
ncbi:response regulator transcription factor [Microbacterium schleiferi]|uniref:Response regulator transcription factor n=1 Tax=Microbacterium schleiferi TaxID=69362 RepID=A0A7S8MVB6_9MICO|nr:response regulator transcription factor [Microbacterium schleiferi]QPE03914.1 response regulator transcription factor [Microbacterium schleiferi]